MTEITALMEIESSTMSDTSPDVVKQAKFAVPPKATKDLFSFESHSKATKTFSAIFGFATLGLAAMIGGVFVVLAGFGFLAAGFYLAKNEGFFALMKAAKITTALEAIKEYMELSVEMKKRYYQLSSIDQKRSEKYMGSNEEIV